MFTTIINDCRDENARGRQESRVAALMETTVSFVGVRSDLEAGMHLLDILDATEGRPGLILVNVAPRGGHTNKWENGTPFAYFWYQEALVVSSVDGFVLSGVKKLNLVSEVHLLDTHTAAAAMRATDFISEQAAQQIPTTQFRSFDFIPRVGVFILQRNTVPSEVYSLSQVADLPLAVWNIDNFGNVKTTLTQQDIPSENRLETRYGAFPYITQLRDVPDDTDAAVLGSSGLGTARFIELVRQRKSFAKHYGVEIGDDLFTNDSHFTQATE